jgi:hypothetical protein
MLGQAKNILTDGKEGKCGLDGMWPLVPSACFTPGEMTGFGWPGARHSRRSTEQPGGESRRGGAHAVQESAERGPLTEVREVSNGQYY